MRILAGLKSTCVLSRFHVNGLANGTLAFFSTCLSLYGLSHAILLLLGLE
jgi:hypothetical protein